MHLQVFKGIQGYAKLEKDWSLLFDSIKEPIYTQSTIWHKAYLNHLCEAPESCYYLSIYKDQELLAIFPFELRKMKFKFLSFRTLMFSTHPHFGLNCTIVKEGQDPESLFNFLFNQLRRSNYVKWDLVYLQRCIEDTFEDKCTISDEELVLLDESQSCDILSISNLKGNKRLYSRNLKRNIKKGLDLLALESKVDFFTSKIKKTHEQSYLDFLNVEASGWKGVGGEKSAIKLDQRLRNFYEEVLLGFEMSGASEINVLSVNSIPIAAQFAIILKNTVYLLKIGYDEAYAKFSPGNVLLDHKLDDYQVDGNLDELNLISDAAWHRQWRPIELKATKKYFCRSNFVALYFRTLLWIKKYLKNRKGS